MVGITRSKVFEHMLHNVTSYSKRWFDHQEYCSSTNIDPRMTYIPTSYPETIFWSQKSQNNQELNLQSYAPEMCKVRPTSWFMKKNIVNPLTIVYYSLWSYLLQTVKHSPSYSMLFVYPPTDHGVSSDPHRKRTFPPWVPWILWGFPWLRWIFHATVWGNWLNLEIYLGKKGTHLRYIFWDIFGKQRILFLDVKSNKPGQLVP